MSKLIPYEELAKNKFHIIGCGATGGKLAEELVRAGVINLVLWDGDTVGRENLTNQIWYTDEIGKLKTQALAERLYRINPNLKIRIKGYWVDELLDGIVMNCVDSIELRREIYEANYGNHKIKLLFDPRVGNRGYSLYMYEWTEANADKLLAFTDFSDDEMEKEDRGPCNQKEYLNFVSWYAVCAIMRNLRNYFSDEETHQQEHWTVVSKFKTNNYK